MVVSGIFKKGETDMAGKRAEVGEQLVYFT